MAPTIPSPTPITGVRSATGKPGVRLPVDVLQKKHEFAFSLYVQALLKWQQNGDKDKDKDCVDGTSYFQVTGVHGVPYGPWQQDPSSAAVPNIGYCTHRSVLFIPWHRPYLMLYEQIIYAYAEEIANEAPEGYARDTYIAALKHVRLPYWDWARDSHLPEVVMQPTIALSIPGKRPGDKDTLTLDHNPLYSYKFTSPYAIETLQKELNWDQTSAWTETKRCPEASGVSNQEISNVQIGTFRAFKWQTFELLTNVKSFDEFTCQAWKNGLAPPSFNSIESMHNNVHNYTGTNDTVMYEDGTKRMGNMTDVQASSFDPVFWLHHVNCDRLTAMWQALNRDIVIETIPSLMPRYNAPVGTEENGYSNLEPWHKSADHDMHDYYVANDTKELGSTVFGGYYYPETPIELFKDPLKMQEFTLGQIYALYGPSKPSVKAAAPEVVHHGIHKDSTPEPPENSVSSPASNADVLTPGIHHSLHAPLRTALAGHTITHWQAFLRVKNFALRGTWAVHIFLGELPADTREWFLSDARIGSVTMLSNSNREQCPNCTEQADSEILVTGTVPLNESLQKSGVDVNDANAVQDFLCSNMTWKVVKDTQNVEITPDLNLTVGVSSQDVTYPDLTTQAPTWGETQIYPAVTAGKLGGLTVDDGDDLGLPGEIFASPVP